MDKTKWKGAEQWKTERKFELSAEAAMGPVV